MKKLTPAVAYTAYAALPEDDRNLSKLREALAVKKFKVSRDTLTKWRTAERWDERIAATKISVSAASLEVVTRTLGELGATTLEDTFTDSAKMIQAVAKTVIEGVRVVPVETVDDARTLAAIVGNMCESLAKVRKMLAEATGAVTSKSETTHKVEFDAEAYRKQLGLAET